MGKTIAIASGKGGTGKTTISANLGVALAKYGKSTIMVDADLDMANMEFVLGMEGRPITLQDVLNGDADLQDTIYETYEGAKLVPAGISPSQFRRVDSDKFVKLIDELAKKADFVLLDCPAGVGKDTATCLSACKETILVITPEPMSIADAYKTKALAEKMGSNVIGVIINMIKGVKNELKEKEITMLLEIPILARIYDDSIVRECVIAGKPIVKEKPNNKVSIAIFELATKLTGEPVIIAAPQKSFFSRLFGFFRR